MNASGIVTEWIVRSVLLGAGAWLGLLLLQGRRWARVRGVVATVALIVLGGLLPASLIEFPRLQVEMPVMVTAALAEVGPKGPTAWLMIVWTAGVALMLTREIVGVIRLRRWIARSTPLATLDWNEALASAKAAVGVQAEVELRACDQIGPCATGWVRPVILLPSNARQWSSEMRRQVLTHELAHFRRCDLWMQAGVRLVSALQWFNPFVPALRRCLETGREMACDREVLRCGGDPIRYAECLLELAAQPCPENSAALAMSLPRRQTQLELRIRELFARDGERGASRAMEVALVAMAMVLLLGCALLRPGTAAAPWNQAEVEMRLAADPFPGN